MISKFWKLFRSFPKQRTTDSKVGMVVHGISAVGHDMVLYGMIYMLWYGIVWYPLQTISLIKASFCRCLAIKIDKLFFGTHVNSSFGRNLQNIYRNLPHILTSKEDRTMLVSYMFWTNLSKIAIILSSCFYLCINIWYVKTLSYVS